MKVDEEQYATVGSVGAILVSSIGDLLDSIA